LAFISLEMVIIGYPALYIYCVRPSKYDWHHWWSVSWMPEVTHRRWSRISWSPVSNTAERSRRTSAAVLPRSTACKMSDNTCKTAVSFKWPGRKPDCSGGRKAADGMTLNCIHIFIVTGSFVFWCVMRPASQRFFIHSCIYLRIMIISYSATFFGTNNLSVLMCRKEVNQSICSTSTILGTNGLNSADVPLSNKQTK